MTFPLRREARWIFIGDSITDCGRRECPDLLGSGYVRFIRDWLLALDPARAPHVINMGIAGNRVDQLEERWDRDILTQSPDLVSIKIGINDVWNFFREGRTGTPLETFATRMRNLLAPLRAAHPGARIVLCEPTVISPPASDAGNEKLAPYIALLSDLAAEFKTSLAPLHAPFLQAEKDRPDIAWTRDGVHPTTPGHMLIARTWLASQGLL